MRFEAWERWRVVACIGAVPAFLELALVLFLVGLLIFVPLFAEHSFTAVVSVAIAITLVIVVTLTILPVFYRMCPFQSPTGWAIMQLKWHSYRILLKLLEHVLVVTRWFTGLIGHATDLERLISLRASVRHWVSTAETVDTWRAHDLCMVTSPELCDAAMQGLDLYHTCEVWEQSPFSRPSPDKCDAVQTRVLTHALTWARRGSMNDENTRAAVMACVSSIHSPFLSDCYAERPHFLSSMVAMCPVDPVHVRSMLRSLFFEDNVTMSFCSGPQYLFWLTDFYGPFIYSYPVGKEFFAKTYLAIRTAWERDPVAYEVCHALICSDLLVLADDWVFSGADSAVAERMAILLCLLRVVPTEDVYGATLCLRHEFTAQWTNTIHELFRKLVSHSAAYRQGLVPMCIEMACRIGPVEFTIENGEHRMTSTF